VPRDKHGTEQVVYYDPGVGTAGLWDKFAGGGFGVGLSHHIKRAYRFIANNYADGDEIFCFGFSRGAYTVRSLSGLIGAVGLLENDQLEFLPEAYKYYRTHPDERPESKHEKVLPKKDSPRRHIPIAFMGVWDTVGALGIPFRGLRWISRKWVGFHNVELSGNIRYAFQALAVDEKRSLFAPAIWTTREEKDEIKHASQRLLQVWFAGAHSNVGGGYACSGLSDVALEWMVGMAGECGLELDAAYLEAKMDPKPVHGVLVDSFTLMYKLVCLRRSDRAITKTCSYMNERVHEGVWRRVDHPASSYAPKNALRVRGSNIEAFRRRFKDRIKGEWPCTITSAGREYECVLLDYSVNGGARVKTPGNLKIDTWVDIESAPVGKTRSEVMWQSNGLIGLRFVQQRAAPDQH
jgi:hypothetical protein